MTGPGAPAARTGRAEAVRLEAAGRLVDALSAYEAALALDTGDVEALCGVARVAGRLDMPEQALALWSEVAALDPGRLEAVDGRARALAALGRHPDAVETLRAAILQAPEEARLWNALGVVLNQQGESASAVVFLDEALRLQPDLAAALYNRGDARFDLGELEGAQADLDAAAACASDADQAAVIAFARALLDLHRGALAEGWRGYEARLRPDHPAAPVFALPGAPWTPQTDLAGTHLLVVGEQGLGDEIMFASLLGDVLAELGTEGRLSLAVEPRLVALMQRSFPSAKVTGHATARGDGRAHRRAPDAAADVEASAPIGSLPRRFRSSADRFVPTAAYLTPDAARVAHWRDWLADSRPAVGLSWRSGLISGRRRRQYPDLAAWAPVLQTRGVRFINLQYGATAAELEALQALAPTPILTPPDIDLKDDLDDLAALCAALDVLVSVPNATAALAAACGAPVWFLTGPGAWPRLGTDGYPWYARARSFVATGFGGWEAPLRSVAESLAELAGAEDSGAKPGAGG